MSKQRLAAAMALTCALCGGGLAVNAQNQQSVATWITVGAPPVASGAAAVALPDGRTLIVGGQRTEGVVTRDVVAFDPTRNEQTPAGQLLAPRLGHTATLLPDGRVLVVGGHVFGAVSGDVELFDPATGHSTLVAQLSTPRSGHAAATLHDGTVLVVGGADANGAVLSSAETVNTGAGTTAPLAASMERARQHASATTLVDGRVLVAGGHDGAQDLASAEMFDPWQARFGPLNPASQLNVPRSGHTALLLPHNNGVLVAGGRSNGVAVTAVDLFVPAEFPDPYSYGMGQFAATAPMGAPRAGAVSGPASDSGHAFVIGGGAADAEVYRYATLQTDKDDYAPGERAVITGSGWQPGETVRLVFQEDPAVHEDYVLYVTADSAGNILWNQWAPEWHDLDVRFYLSASDSRSRAQITFTDGLPQTVSLSPTSVSVTAGASAEFQVTVQMGGNNSACTITLEVTSALPTGVTAAFNNNPVNATNQNFSRTLTFTTTNSGPAAGRTPAGTYPFTVRAAKAANCVGGPAPTAGGTLIVSAPAATTALAVDPASGTYGGSVALSATLTSNGTAVAAKSVDFVLNGTSVGSALTDSSGVAMLTDVSLDGVSAGTYPAGVSASFGGDTSYLSSNGTNTLTVERADAAVSVSGYSGVYDGQPHGATGTATGVAGENLSGLLSLGASFTDAPGGTASWTFAGDTNYNPQSGSVAIAIARADAALVVSGFSGVYDGDPHGATGSATGVNGEDLSDLLDLGASFTDVPGGTASWSFAGNGNYNEASGTAAVEISRATATITVTGYIGTYDGNAHGASGTATGVKGEDLSSLLDLGETYTDVPGGIANWSFSGGTNYNTFSGSVEVAIARADATLAVQGYTGVYDGNPHGATGTATGVKGEDLSAALTLGDSFTDVPGGTAHWSFAGGTNYNDAAGSVAIHISKADALINVTGFSGAYDGNAHGAAGTATGAKGEDLSAALSLGESFTDVPGGTASWSFAGGNNYNDAAGSVTIEINKANATIAVQGYAGVYDGEAHGATGTATGVKGEDLGNLLTLGGSFTNVPGGTATWTFAGNNNYNEAGGTASIAISKADAAIIVTGYTGIYDGNAHGATGSVTGVKGEDLTAGLNLGATFTNAPGGTAIWTFAGGTNYNDATGGVEIAIAKANADITVTGYTGIFDHYAHGATGSATGVKGEDLTHLLSLGDTFSMPPGGTATWTFAGDTNYNQATGTVTIVINPWHVTGFYQPVTMGGSAVVNTVKGGSTVPLKFNLYESAGGTELTSVGEVMHFQVFTASCQAAVWEDPVDFTTSGGTSLRYDAVARQFVQNWQTPRGAGHCYRVVMTAQDGSQLTAYFKTK